MADEEKESQGAYSDGIDWEVVSLTASTYAAAPGPIRFDPPNESKDKEFNKNEKESSSPLFMSSHFVFPSMENESLKLKDKHNEIDNKFTDEDVIPDNDKGGTTNKTLQESFKTKLDDSLRGIQFSGKEKGLSVGGIDFGEGKQVQEMSLVLEEQVPLASYGFDDYHAESGGGSFPGNEQSDNPKLIDPSYQTLYCSNCSNASSQREENNDVFDLPCGAWWKRHAINLYNHAKEAHTLWPVIVAAALVGLAILGQRKQREKPQLQQLQLCFSTNDQSVNLILGPMNQIKSILTSDRQHSSPLGAVTSNIGGAC